MAIRSIKSKKRKPILSCLLTLIAISFFGLVCTKCQSTHSPLAPPLSEAIAMPSPDSVDLNKKTVICPVETQPESLRLSCEIPIVVQDEKPKKVSQKAKSKLEANRSKAIEWLDERATRAPREDVIEYIDFVSKNIEPRYQLVVLAILTIESEGDPNAKSSDGSLGLTQILPRCWEKELKAQGIIKCRRDLFDFRKNILACQYILQKHSIEGRSLKRVLIRYNRSNKYVRNVIDRIEHLKKAL